MTSTKNALSAEIVQLTQGRDALLAEIAHLQEAARIARETAGVARAEMAASVRAAEAAHVKLAPLVEIASRISGNLASALSETTHS